MSSTNWIDPPFNREGYRRVRELTRTARVTAGRRTWDLPRRQHLLAGLPVDTTLGQQRLVEVLEQAWVDSLVVVHDGVVVYEHHRPEVDPTATHLLMSVSKSVASLLAGTLVDDGMFGLDDTVETHLEELRGTAWESCTIQHLLDMRAGVRFDEHDMSDPECAGRVIEWISGYTLPARPDLPAHTRDWIVGLEPKGSHGTRYEYQSICTDVLAWVIERTTGRRYAEVLSERIWQPMGMGHDADLIVDAVGFPVAEGGLCVTPGDLARLGQMMLDGGVADGRRIVPERWLDRIVGDHPQLVAHFAAGHDSDRSRPGAYYHDCWWVLDPERPAFRGLGLGGQQLYVDRGARLVVAVLSSTPERIDPAAARLVDATIDALRAHLQS